jgi:hypothetical protein
MFATVVAATKDLPDVEGDKVSLFLGWCVRGKWDFLLCQDLISFTSPAFQTETFITKVGVKHVAQGASFCLLANTIHAVATGLLAKPGAFRIFRMVGGHAALAAILIAQFQQLCSDSPLSKRFTNASGTCFVWNARSAHRCVEQTQRQNASSAHTHPVA